MNKGYKLPYIVVVFGLVFVVTLSFATYLGDHKASFKYSSELVSKRNPDDFADCVIKLSDNLPEKRMHYLQRPIYGWLPAGNIILISRDNSASINVYNGEHTSIIVRTSSVEDEKLIEVAERCAENAMKQ